MRQPRISPSERRPPVLSSTELDLAVGERAVNLTGKPRVASVVNGSLPAPMLRWREGDTVTIRVRNELAEPTSIHWHGLVLPANMDGVPGLSFHGIAPGETFTYRFPLRQSGTYWYHSHSAFQEQAGLYGALVIEPREPEPFSLRSRARRAALGLDGSRSARSVSAAEAPLGLLQLSEAHAWRPRARCEARRLRGRARRSAASGRACACSRATSPTSAAPPTPIS